MQGVLNLQGSRTLILHKTGHRSGRKHDYDIYKHNHPITPSQVDNIVDLGYLGIEKDFPTVKSVLPIENNPDGKEDISKLYSDLKDSDCNLFLHK